jgi:hypothetical protein
MDDPGACCDLMLDYFSNSTAETEIPGVIRDLTQTPPSTQHETINKYFTSDASFTHPFCRTGSFYWTETFNSRNLVHGIYRWYKIMSPRIDLKIDSIGANGLERRGDG